MKIPIHYSYRSLVTRRLTTLLTASGMALVVFVFAASLMLAEGLRVTLVATGDPANAVVIRKGADTEVQSGLERDKAAIAVAQPEVAVGGQAEYLTTKESVVLINLLKRGTGSPSNVTIRGVGPRALQMRPQVRLMAGRAPRPGQAEVMAGKRVAERFVGAGLGETVRLGGRDWLVVGVFDAGNSGFSSEIWGDADLLMQSFRRDAYSSVTLTLRDAALVETLKQRLEGDPRLTVDVFRETTYYEKQSKALATFLTVVGVSLTVIFSLGAVLGAVITMHAAVAGRITEIGALRAIGFRRRDILIAFLTESLLLGLLGGLGGLFCASFLQFLTISTTNFQTFAELAFTFTLTPGIAATALAFALLMGLLGGLAPSVKACRVSIVSALRAA